MTSAEGVQEMAGGILNVANYAIEATSSLQNQGVEVGLAMQGIGNASSDMSDVVSASSGKAATSTLEAQDALIKYNEKIKEINDNIADVMAGTNITDAISKYNDTLQSDQQAYADKVTSINQQIADAQANLLQTEADNAQNMNDTLQDMQDSQADKMANTKEKQAQEIADATTAAEKAALVKKFNEENQLAEDSYNRAYATKQSELQRNVDQENVKAQEAANSKIATYQNELAQEATLENQKEAKLKSDLDDEVAKDKEANDKKLAQYQQELADEERSYQLSQEKRASGGGAANKNPAGWTAHPSGEFGQTKQSLEDIIGLTEKLAITTPFPISDLVQGNTQLMLAKVNTDQLDPAIANIAARSGKSFSSIAMITSSAILHGGTMLRQFATQTGLTMEDFDKALGKPMGYIPKSANEVAKAIQVIGETTKGYSGAAQAFGDTYSGQLGIINNKLELLVAHIFGVNILTDKPSPTGLFSSLLKMVTEFSDYLTSHEDQISTFASSVISSMTKVGGAIASAFSWISEHWGIIETGLKAIGVVLAIMATASVIGGIIAVVSGIMAFVGAISAAVQVAIGLGSIMPIIGTVIAALGGPFTVIAAIIVGLGIVLYELITHWQQVKDFVVEAVGVIDKTIAQWIASAEARISAWANNITTSFSQLWATAKKNWSDWFNWAINGIKAFVDGAVSGFNNLVKELKTIFDNIGNFFNSMIKTFETWGENLANSFVNGIKNILKDVGSVLTGPIQTAFNMFKGHSPPTEGPLREIDKWGYNIGMSWVQGFQQAIGGLTMPNLSSFGTAGGGSQTLNSINNPQTSNVTLNNVFNVNSQANAQMVTQYLALQAEHFGLT